MVTQQSEKKIGEILLAILSIIAVLIIGGGVFGYFYYLRETPEKVIKKMINRLTDVKTLEHQGEIKGKITVPDLDLYLLGGDNLRQPPKKALSKKAVNFLINFNGKSDVGDLNNPKGSFILNIKTEDLKELTQEEAIFGLEVRNINKATYIKLSNPPKLGFLDLGFLSNQWIKFNPEAIKKQFKLEELEEPIQEEREERQELTPGQIEKIKKLMRQANIFKVKEKLTGEKIEGVNTHHYKFLIDKNKLKKLILDISRVLPEPPTKEELAELDKGLEAIEFIGGELWIGKKDYLPYKILLTIRVKETAESKTAGQVTATISFKNYNKPVQIDIPSPVKNIEEIIGQLFGGVLDKIIQSPDSQLPDFQLPNSQPSEPSEPPEQSDFQLPDFQEDL